MSAKRNSILDFLDYLDSDELRRSKKLIRENADRLTQRAVLDAFTVASSALQLATALASTVLEDAAKPVGKAADSLTDILHEALDPENPDEAGARGEEEE